jgi:hypothetical protein
MRNEVNKNAICEAAVLVFRMGGIYDAHRWDDITWHNILTKIHENWHRHSSNVKFLLQQFEWL